jgi:hypothetical protein
VITIATEVEDLWFIFEIATGYPTEYAVTRKRMGGILYLETLSALIPL